MRAHEVTVDASLLWVGAGLAMAAAVLLAYIPRLPSTHAPTGLGLASGSLRITPGTNRRLRVFATTQIAFSFVLLAGAGMLLAALIALQTAHTGYNMRQVLAIDLPTLARSARATPKEISRFYQEMAPPRRRAARRGGRGARQLRAVARRRQHGRPASSSPSRAHAARTARRTRTRRLRIVAPGLLLGARRAADRRPRLHRPTIATAASRW